MELHIEYTLDKDITNYKLIANAAHTGGPSKVLNLYCRRFGDVVTDDHVAKFIDGFVSYNKLDVEFIRASFSASWARIEQEASRRLDAMFNYHLPLGQMRVYLTSNDRSGYALAENYFFLSMLTASPNKVILHELLHFYAWRVWGTRLRTLDTGKAYAIAEALTELLNLEFADLIESPDSGYPQHRALRELIKQAWSDDQNIENLFERLFSAVDEIHL